MQKPFGSSVAHHMNGPYHRALFAVVTAQLSTGQRHADGVAGLLALLQDMPLVRRAVAAHARTRGISLRERLAPPPAKQATGDASLESAAAHFTASQHWAALYAICGEEGDGSESGGDGGSGDERRASEALIPVPQLPGPSGTAPNIAGASSSSSEGVHADQLREAPPLHGAAPDAGQAATAAPERPARWRCPLSCRGEQLPAGARLRENVLDMGAAPNMRACRRRPGRRRLWASCNALADTGAASTAMAGEAGPGVAAPSALPS